MTWQEQLAALRPLIGHIKDYEAKIIIDMHKRMISYGDECRMSEKQVALVDKWYYAYCASEAEADKRADENEAEFGTEVEPEPEYIPPAPEPEPEVTSPPPDDVVVLPEPTEDNSSFPDDNSDYIPPAGW